MKYLLVLLFFSWHAVLADVALGDPLFRENAVADYLIIAPADSGILTQARRLGELKNEKGLRARVVTTDSITRNVPGKDTQEKIRNLIMAAAGDWRITWVLLMGDYERIPARGVWSMEHDSAMNSIPMNSDIYYSCLGDGWEADRNGEYGTGVGEEGYRLICRFDSAGHYVCDSVVLESFGGVDFRPDVYLGRLPASNAADAEIMVDKILRYGYRPQNSDYTTRILFLGENALGSLYSMEDSGYIDDASYYWHRDMKPIYADPGSVFSGFGFDEIYEDSVTPDGKILDAEILRDTGVYLDQFSHGANLVYYVGHGDPLSWEIGSFTTPKTYLYEPQVRNFASGTLMNIITMACKTMLFNNGVCMAKSFMANPRGGAISYCANSGNDYPSSTITPLKDMAEYLANGSATRLVKAMVHGYLKNSSGINGFLFSKRAVLFARQFWGDPELELWTRPITAADTFSIGIFRISEGTYHVSVVPPEDSVFICLYKPGVLQQRGYARNGGITFTGIPDTLNAVKITATRHNFLPSQIQVDMGAIGIERQAAALGSGHTVQACPNPFNPATTIRIVRPFKKAAIRVYDVTGKILARFNNVRSRDTEWNAKGLPSGMYVLEVLVDGRTCRKTLVLAR